MMLPIARGRPSSIKFKRHRFSYLSDQVLLLIKDEIMKNAVVFGSKTALYGMGYLDTDVVT
jgi:hypothetical protein